MKKPKRSRKTISESAVQRAFARAIRNPDACAQAIERFMRGNSVPPSWTFAGIRAEFGIRVARSWARHLRHLSPARFQSYKGGPWQTPVVQHIADRQPTRHSAGHKQVKALAIPAAPGRDSAPFGFDEYWAYAKPIPLISIALFKE
jgi:hypothetical protein